MNNRMTIDNFLDAGGIIEVRLQRDLLRFGFERIYFCAGSQESAREMQQWLYKTERQIRRVLHREDMCIDQFIENVFFCWNRTIYELEPGHPSLVKVLSESGDMKSIEPGRYRPYYLIAIGKCL